MKQNKKRSRELVATAHTFLGKGQLSEALAASIEACTKDASNADAWFLQAAVHAQRQDFGEVAECCLKVIRLQPQNAPAYFNLGVARQSAGDSEAAVSAYREAIRLQPGYTAARANLGGLLVELGQVDEALELAEVTLKKTPDAIDMCALKGLALLRMGRAEDALHWLKEAEKSYKQAPSIMHNIARCYLALGDMDEARTVLDRLTGSSAAYAPAWAEWGRLELEQEHYSDAARCYESAARLQPTRENQFNLAHCLYASGKIEPARRLYHEMLTRYPDEPLVHNNLGRLYERIGGINEAERYFRRAVELQPGQAIPHCNLGRILLGLGRLGEALGEYDAAINADPDYFEGHYGRGQVLCEQGEKKGAIESFRTALTMKPELTDAKYYIASMGGEGADEEDRHAYVAGLFDKYAGKFEDELVEGLKYQTPKVLFDLVDAVLPDQERRYDILDLGCGTGLCGPLFQPMANRLVGMDLSPKMVEEAGKKEIYDELAVADVTEFMNGAPGDFDIIIAGDVFVYIGELSEVFEAAWRALRPNGYFAFSTEAYDGTGFKLRGSGRHAHATGYINELAAKSGFHAVDSKACDLRLEYGKPIRGVLYVYRRRD